MSLGRDSAQPPGVLDHLTLLVTDYDRSREFYLSALAPLGVEMVMELTRAQIPSLGVDKTCGMGQGKPTLWLSPSASVTPTHIAFTAPDRTTVDAFHRAALAAGAKDNGAPGVRPHYHPDYYGAFVIDPDGYNIEVVCHQPSS